MYVIFIFVIVFENNKITDSLDDDNYNKLDHEADEINVECIHTCLYHDIFPLNH